MNSFFPVSIVRQHFGTLLLTGLFVGAASFFALTVTQKHFETTADFMVVQAGATNQDFYTLSRSSEYLGKVFSEAIYSERFINAVIETGKVNQEFLPFDKSDRLAAWRSMVNVKNNAELGILNISVQSDSEREATRIMDAIGAVLIEKNSLFRAGDEKGVDVRILSGPITERNPSGKEIISVVLGGFLFSVFVAILYFFLRAEFRTEREEAYFATETQ